ncbi:MAG: phytanoyl-CoA dioxygenase family protein, partial [Verrucomicrobia bacterium]|nr:phytanoyl-CoA dioxygenase family protein [Verrucomicrobiota bacterium]
MALTAEQLDEYHEKGFIVVPGLIDAATREALSDEVDGIHERMAAHTPPEVGVSWEEDLAEGAPPRIRQLMHSERVSPVLGRISRSDAMLDIMGQLIGPSVYLFHSKLMLKAAKFGTFTPWHQDWGYWQNTHTQPTQVNCMLSIDASTEENGAIRFVPGSHKAGAIDHKKFKSSSFNIGLDGDIDAYESELVTT